MDIWSKELLTAQIQMLLFSFKVWYFRMAINIKCSGKCNENSESYWQWHEFRFIEFFKCSWMIRGYIYAYFRQLLSK